MMQYGLMRSDWRDHPDLDAGMLAVLAVLVTYADQQGICWPGQGTIAQKCRRSRPWVNGILKRLVEFGILKKTRRRYDHNGERTCLYQLIGHDEILTPPVGPSPTNTPKDQDQDSLSVGDRPEVVEPELIEVPEEWTPDGPDTVFLAKWRAELFDIPGLIGRSTQRFIHHARSTGKRFHRIGSAWRCWMLAEMTRLPKPASPSPKPPQGGDLAAENARRADDCLERILARRARE